VHKRRKSEEELRLRWVARKCNKKIYKK